MNRLVTTCLQYCNNLCVFTRVVFHIWSSNNSKTTWKIRVTFFVTLLMMQMTKFYVVLFAVCSDYVCSNSYYICSDSYYVCSDSYYVCSNFYIKAIGKFHPVVYNYHLWSTATDLTLLKLKLEFPKISLKYSSTVFWNQLPNEAKLVKSLHSFKSNVLLDNDMPPYRYMIVHIAWLYIVTCVC